MSSTPRASRRPLADDPQWYKDAVIYEVRTRSFYDSNGDGIGDLAGLTEKLDYLHDLGITALWLLPLMPSPGRDDGYDISEYFDVHPDVGTIADFQKFVDEAHRRSIRVITELVCNHTSDAHPWFQRARRAPIGSTERNFYVWSDTPERYKEARIIFKDFEPSNWTWDPVAKQYFWHRFFSHQPDLNFEEPAVQAALFEVVDFWLAMGVDGVRLDAVPYLYEEEGTNCENLPKTHAFLKKLRAHIDEKFKGKMLLAEANQWPEDAAAYFGDGDECHMNFHFPIMPRMFMAMHMEDRFPLMDILAQTPQLHPSCQWAMFLRNHDELTLEMVTDEERDYMYRAYAHEQAMRINLGIRRRLAPLCGNDRRKMELLNGLLFSMPGTPVLYYGDEIGMGDNIYLGDRNGVRTPMQWSMDRNAGFSRANPQRLILPIVIDPEYHFESLNVEQQQNNSSSLLWWTKRIISLRKRFKAFGRGSIEYVNPTNAKVFAFIRAYEDELILVVANLSRFVQCAELDLSRFKGMQPLELFGRAKFPVIGEAPYMITLTGHSFYWFSFRRRMQSEARMSLYEAPILEVGGLDTLLHDERASLEELLPRFFESRRWFAGHDRAIMRLSIVEAATVDPGRLALAFVRVEYSEGEPESYVLPLAVVEDANAGQIPPAAVIARLRSPVPAILIDAVDAPTASRAFLELIAEKRRARATAGDVVAQPFVPVDVTGSDPKALVGEHSDAAIRFGDKFLLKVFRRLEEGTSPELEVARFVKANAPQQERPLVPEVAGAIEYKAGRNEPVTLAALLTFIPNEGTAWTVTRDELRRLYERVLTQKRNEAAPELPSPAPVALLDAEIPQALVELFGPFIDTARLLGQRTAELHRVLASRDDDPAFAPEPFSSFDRRSVYQSVRNNVGTVMRTLRADVDRLPSRSAQEHAKLLMANEEAVLKRFEPMLSRKLEGLRIRTHGDFHLGQVLATGRDFVIIDFEGDRQKALSERRRKRSPLRDVAAMIRSFQYAALVTLFDDAIVRDGDRNTLAPWAHQWHAWISNAYLKAYLGGVEGQPFAAFDREELAMMLDVFVFNKAFSELGDELRRHDPRVIVPLHGLARMLG